MSAADGFSDFNLDERLIRRLDFRIIYQPTEIQRLSIPAILAGESLAFRSATGTGKTFAYLLPLVHRLVQTKEGGALGRISPHVQTRARDSSGIGSKSASLRILSMAFLPSAKMPPKAAERPCLIPPPSVAAIGADSPVPAEGGNAPHFEMPEIVSSKEKSPPIPRILILSPTLELAAQIKSETDFLLDELPFKAVLCTGGGNMEHQMRAIKKDKPEMVIGNPSRLLKLFYTRKLKLSAIQTLVLDEADRLIAPEQRDEAAELINLLPACRQNIALSATLEQGGLEALSELCRCRFGFVQSDKNEALRELIEHWAIWCERRDSFLTLRSLLAAVRFKKILIFAETAEEIRQICAKLQRHKRNAVCLYSGQDKKERKAALDSFRRGEKKGGADILVSSDLAARGLDIAEISHVVTLGIHEDENVYLHRAGRCGRCGRRGICISIGGEADMRRLQTIEKKLRITVYPKELYGGKVLAPYIPGEAEAAAQV
ncbi:MAG: DEAD/DEAH box helicase [Spirochaetaceae bacterium]|jgi:superfamily II DNA/RNA helicase|nr:DEAD/DEAH box helicase [Spirochaetaceae bacterium]